jgi:nitrate/TMAO reductase-like tetraheme cytochrome c subunit
MSPSRPRSRAILLLVGAAALLAGFGVVAWRVSDRLEQENAFCLGCHLTAEVRLHDRVGRDFERRPPASLAARHAEAAAAATDRDGFRCIECHGGTSWPGRLRIKVMAASDAFWYATGRFEEPDRMAWPLWDEDCRKCHTSLGAPEARAWDAIPFHEVNDHDRNLGVACVECHLAHDEGVDREASFLRADHVRAQCARCHSDFRDEE